MPFLLFGSILSSYMRNSLSSVRTKFRAVFSQARLESVVGLATAWVDKDLGGRCGKKHPALSPPFTQQNQPAVAVGQSRRPRLVAGGGAGECQPVPTPAPALGKSWGHHQQGGWCCDRSAAVLVKIRAGQEFSDATALMGSAKVKYKPLLLKKKKKARQKPLQLCQNKTVPVWTCLPSCWFML